MKRKREGSMSRRKFLKATTAGALVLTAAPAIIISRRVEAYRPGGTIHPKMDPLRVVGLTDPGMTTELRESASWRQQEELVSADAVYDNMDRLAMALAEESATRDAWRKIFVKPPGKSWSDVLVGIKTNQLGVQRTRAPVMRKVCRVLTDVIGVKGSNIHIYDACTGGDGPGGGSIRGENHFRDLPDGVHLADRWGGYRAFRTAVPEPYLGGTRRCGCLAHLVADRVDILVNLALCKGSTPPFGGFTMCMKNHFGTFDPIPSHRDGGNADYLIAINKTPEILGRMEPSTGNVLFPRQQLCIVDALWASERGPNGLPSSQPNTLLMGTFAPAVDYLAATRLRRDRMGWAVNGEVVSRLLADFGYGPTDLPNGGQIIDAMAAG
ncbi:MAG: DUF362 domain-containing protein [Planctomycetota bacterium]|jgi:hypothetical protein